MRLAATLILFSFNASSVHGALELVKDLQVGPVRSVTLVGLPRGDEIALQAELFLGSPQIKFGRLVVYESSDLAKLGVRESYFSCSPDDIKSFLTANRLLPPPSHCPLVWEVIKSGPNMLQRSVDRGCRTTRVLLRGNSDPLLVNSGSASFELLHISIKVIDRPSALAREGPFPSIEVFVRTKANLDESRNALKRILLDIKRLSGARFAAVIARNDALFAYHCAFPALYFFDNSPPTIAAPGDSWLRGAELDCRSMHPFIDVRCSYYPPKPNR